MDEGRMTGEVMDEAARRRFWGKVNPPDKDGHMFWAGAKTAGGYGYLWVNGKARRAHRLSLVMAQGVAPFEGAEAAHAPEVCHQPSCIAPAHLRWASRSQNKADELLDGTRNRGERQGIAKLTEPEVSSIRKAYAGGSRQHALAAQFGVSRSLISYIVNRKGWKHI
jgi:hypothetical protein